MFLYANDIIILSHSWTDAQYKMADVKEYVNHLKQVLNFHKGKVGKLKTFFIMVNQLQLLMNRNIGA